LKLKQRHPRLNVKLKRRLRLRLNTKLKRRLNMTLGMSHMTRPEPCLNMTHHEVTCKIWIKLSFNSYHI